MKKDRDSSQAPRGEIPAEPKRGRGRHRKGNTTEKPTINNIYINKEDNKNVLIPEIVDNSILMELININMKDDFSEREIKFLEYYLSGEVKQENAARLAGYASTCDRYLRKIAQKIVQKYESRTEDHRKIMRALGYGEVKVLQLLIDSATKAQSETVKLNARIALAKCLGMQKEVIDAVEGVQIVIRSHQTAGEQPTTAAQHKPVAPPASTPAPGFRVIK